jgi:hypothetical protein
MFNTLRILTLLSFLAVPMSLWSQYEQMPAEQGSAQAPDAQMTAEGTLSRVDPASKTIWIAGADGSEQQFLYTDQTEVHGADGTVEGLANQSGKSLRITFQSSGDANTALKIEVL